MESWSVHELKKFLGERGVDYSGCFEKHELVELAQKQPPRPAQPAQTDGTVHHVHSRGDWDRELSAAGPRLVVVDFFATWCGPCKFISPKVEALARDRRDVVFLKVDVDEVPDVAQSCAISAMPTFQLFKRGAKLDEVVGADERRLRALIDKHH